MTDRHGLLPLLERVLADPDHTRDPDAWAELLGRLHALALALLQGRVRQAADAADLAQEVQRKILVGFPAFRGTTLPAVLAWVRLIIRSVLVDHQRRSPPPTAALPDECPAAPPAGPRFDTELLDRVVRWVRELPEPRRRIVTAFYLEDRSCAEIAAELSRPAGWVRVTKMHAVRELRERFRRAN